MVLRDITSATSDTVHFLQSHGILQHDVSCPGPALKVHVHFLVVRR